MIQTVYDPPPEFGQEAGSAAEARSQATRERILDAAERLFAAQGFAGTSHRQITAEAGVNLAAVNYHFGSKEELFLAVVKRRLEPVNRRRLEMLEAAEAAPGGARIEDVARAFAGPVVEARRAGGVLPQLMARVVGEPGGWAEKLLPVAFGAVAARFLAALERAMRGVPREELVWGLVFSAGVLSHYMLLGDLLQRVAGGKTDAGPDQGMDERMVRYIAAGLRALGGAGAPGAAAAQRARGKAARKRGKGREGR